MADATVESLIDNGIDTLFCLPGVQNDHFFEAVYKVQDRIRPVHTRHEQGAAYMALGAAMATGRPAAYCVVPGPGVLNTAGALCTAYACNAPVLALTGQIPQRHIGAGHGFLHELPDQLATMRSLTKWADRITGPQDAQPLVNEAFRQMTSGRPRPVALECAIDVWGRRGEITRESPRPPVRIALDQEAVARATALLSTAERPLIVVGGGALHAADEVQAISDLLQAPVVSNRMGRGILDSDDPLAVNWTTGHRLWGRADVVLAVGTRLQVQQMMWGVPVGTRIVRIEIDAVEMERIAPPEVAILGDAKDALHALVEQLAGQDRPSRAAEIGALKHQVADELAVLSIQKDFLSAIRSALPDDGIFVDELTQVGYASRLLFPVHEPRTFLTPGYQGTLGWGYATALGAKVACPEKAVVSVSGDGGFMFNVQELATAVQHGIGVVAIVFDDGAFGNVRRLQQQQFGHTIVSDLRNPDFVALARSFGMAAVKVEDARGLESAVRDGLKSGAPLLIHVPVGAMPDPWKFINMPRIA
ncbi:thiamine pyrophosphate-dependent enzyme [Sphingomonas sp. LB2R24]|uniref:thiamine pyrophosphate-dependent enzyme n=1 Tax=Sphingomonas sorbitolis TaxID=3096165 RepID=UPI002FC7597C